MSAINKAISLRGSATKSSGSSVTNVTNVTEAVPTNLAALTDINLTGLQDDYILVYDAASGKWVPEAKPAGSAATPTVTDFLIPEKTANFMRLGTPNGFSPSALRIWYSRAMKTGTISNLAIQTTANRSSSDFYALGVYKNIPGNRWYLDRPGQLLVVSNFVSAINVPSNNWHDHALGANYLVEAGDWLALLTKNGTWSTPFFGTTIGAVTGNTGPNQNNLSIWQTWNGTTVPTTAATTGLNFTTSFPNITGF